MVENNVVKTKNLLDKDDENDIRLKIISNTGYWEMDNKFANILRTQEKKREVRAFMKLHEKQISEIMKYW